ncbi:MAG: hypothetical protein IT304_10485 [Dehalococcoidia bacterium]|nr:hypothetical protein [Dehalococcoidia bacterium]
MRVGAFVGWIAGATLAGAGALVLALGAAGAARSPSAEAWGVADLPAEEVTLGVGNRAVALAVVACMRDAGLAVAEPEPNLAGSYDISYGPFPSSEDAEHAGEVFRACYAAHLAGVQRPH